MNEVSRWGVVLRCVFWVMTVTSLLVGTANAQIDYSWDPAPLVDDLGQRIARELLKERDKRGQEVLQVAVMPFGDQNGQVTQDLFVPSKIIQGELLATLRNLGARKVLYWDAGALQQKVLQSKANLANLSPREFAKAAEELAKLGLDAAIVGSFQEGVDSSRIDADILFSQGAPFQVSAKGNGQQPPLGLGETRISTRFSVDILVDGKPLELLASRNSDQMYVELDRDSHYGKPFTLRLKNHGLPPAGWIAKTRTGESSRFFCAAVYVDGVSTLYEKGPDGDYHPSQRHPKNVRKWVLTAPGTEVLPGYHTNTNTRRQRNVRGDGQATLQIVGFQKDKDKAAQFVFADAGESFAHEIGMTKDIGLISVYFFAEDIRGDEPYFGPGAAGAAPGVMAGPVVSNKVYDVTVVTHDEEPVEVWNIYYLYRGQKDSIASRRNNGEQIDPIKKLWAEVKQQLAGDPPFLRNGRRVGESGIFGSRAP